MSNTTRKNNCSNNAKYYFSDVGSKFNYYVTTESLPTLKGAAFFTGVFLFNKYVIKSCAPLVPCVGDYVDTVYDRAGSIKSAVVNPVSNKLTNAALSQKFTFQNVNADSEKNTNMDKMKLFINKEVTTQKVLNHGVDILTTYVVLHPQKSMTFVKDVGVGIYDVVLGVVNGIGFGVNYLGEAICGADHDVALNGEESTNATQG